MVKKMKGQITKYLLRGLVATIIGSLISLPITFFITLMTFLVGLPGLIIFLIVYIPLSLTISGYIMTKVVKDWIK